MTLLRGLVTQWEVVHALILRETRTRFGKNQLGYVWALFEPLLMILTFWILFAIMGRPAPYGMDLYGFIGTGIVPYLLFANSVNRVAESINGNRSLLVYPQVMPIDLVIARTILEAVTYAAVFIVLMGAQALITEELVVHDPLDLLIGFAMASLLGTGLGLVFCGLGEFSAFAERTRPVVLRPFFWVSGIFFTADHLPESLREPALLNPVLHCTEYIRAGWYPSYTTEHADPMYAVAWILGLSFFGLSLERVVRRRIELS